MSFGLQSTGLLNLVRQQLVQPLYVYSDMICDCSDIYRRLPIISGTQDRTRKLYDFFKRLA